jgi:hypothetical protein
MVIKKEHQMNPSGVTQMLARLPIETIKEKLHIYEQLCNKNTEDIMVQDMLNKEVERRIAQLVA